MGQQRQFGVRAAELRGRHAASPAPPRGGRGRREWRRRRAQEGEAPQEGEEGVGQENQSCSDRLLWVDSLNSNTCVNLTDAIAGRQGQQSERALQMLAMLSPLTPQTAS